MGESATSRRSSYRPPLSRHYSSWMRKKGRYVADYFAGHGGVARSVQKLGLATRASDLRHGVNHDLTCPKVLYKIREDIFGAHVISSMLAPPCATFSAACDRSGILHTAEDPLGLPTLTGADHEKSVPSTGACAQLCALFVTLKLVKCPGFLRIHLSAKLGTYQGFNGCRDATCAGRRHRFVSVR